MIFPERVFGMSGTMYTRLGRAILPMNVFDRFDHAIDHVSGSAPHPA